MGQLLAYGAQDRYLAGTPSIDFISKYSICKNENGFELSCPLCDMKLYGFEKKIECDGIIYHQKCFNQQHQHPHDYPPQFHQCP